MHEKEKQKIAGKTIEKNNCYATMATYRLKQEKTTVTN